MAYDSTKLTRLSHLQALAQKVVDNYATKAELEAVAVPVYTIIKDETSSDYAAVYNLTKDGVATGATINIPKDMVVQSGEVVTNPEGQTEGTYLHLVLANADDSDIYINVGDLIEYVTSGSADGDDIVVTVSADHKVTAALSASITATLAEVANKVDAVDGKGLSANDYTDEEKAKLAAIEEGANAYELPTASATVLGGVKVGNNLTIDEDGVLSAADSVTYSEATTTAAGLMSASDKEKLDGMEIATDAEVTEMLDEVFETAE